METINNQSGTPNNERKSELNRGEDGDDLDSPDLRYHNM